MGTQFKMNAGKASLPNPSGQASGVKSPAERDMMLPAMGATLASDSAQSERVDKTLPVEVSVVIPCLNEANSLAFCVDKAVKAFRASGLSGEEIGRASCRERDESTL